MTNPDLPAISPTVANILSAFFERLDSETIVDGATIERLCTTLEAQKTDAQSLRAALFGQTKTL